MINLKNIQKQIMSFPVLEQYKQQYPEHASLLNEFETYYNKKLWHELSKGVLIFIFQKDVHGKITFDFYTDFVKKFDRNIDQITHLKILNECLANVKAPQAIEFLEKYEEKDAVTDECKNIVAAFRANYYVNENFEKCFELYQRLDKFLKERKDADPFAFSSFYKFSMNYFLKKKKEKAYYDHALQFIAYTPESEIEESTKVQLLANMGMAALVSKEIYNFSELKEQPMLRSLADSPYRWVYELIDIFNRGDIETYCKVQADALSRNSLLNDSRNFLEEKIRLMSFLELAFNLPKSDRVVSFEKLSNVCATPLGHVEFMVMKAAALGLVKVQIDQLAQQVLVTWVAPKVLGNEKISTMLGKFEEWEKGVDGVRNYMLENRKVEA